MAGTLKANPDEAFFRYVTIGVEAAFLPFGDLGVRWIDCYIANVGDVAVNITAASWTTGTKFVAFFPGFSSGGTIVPSPITIAPGAQVQLKFGFIPIEGDEDTLLSDTLSITNNGSVNPLDIDVSGWALETGRGATLYFSPSSWSFDWVNGIDHTAGIDVGLWSNVFNLGLVNGGDDLLTINSITSRWPFRLVDPLPQLPAVLAPRAALYIHVQMFVDVSGVTSYPEALEVINNGFVPTELFVADVNGLAITSTQSVTGGRKSLAAFGSTVLQFDPVDLEVERPARLVKTLDMRLPHLEKTLTRLRARYEDLGEATFRTTVQTPRETSTPVDTAVGTVGADELFKEALVSKELTEQTFKLTVAHVDGPLSFVDFGVDHEPRGPVVV